MSTPPLKERQILKKLLSNFLALEAWRGGISAVIENLVLASDDAPTGVKAALTAAKKAVAAGTKASAMSVKLLLLKAKLVSTNAGFITAAVTESIDKYVAMDNQALELELARIESELMHLTNPENHGAR